MATQTGKRARKAGGNRWACKRNKAKRAKKKTFGHLAYSVSAKNAEQAVAANERLVERVAAERANAPERHQSVGSFSAEEVAA